MNTISLAKLDLVVRLAYMQYGVAKAIARILGFPLEIEGVPCGEAVGILLNFPQEWRKLDCCRYFVQARNTISGEVVVWALGPFGDIVVDLVQLDNENIEQRSLKMIV